jgi:hypothetical protein
VGTRRKTVSKRTFVWEDSNGIIQQSTRHPLLDCGFARYLYGGKDPRNSVETVISSNWELSTGLCGATYYKECRAVFGKYWEDILAIMLENSTDVHDALKELSGTVSDTLADALYALVNQAGIKLAYYLDGEDWRPTVKENIHGL